MNDDPAERLSADIVIVGGGIAGLTAALKLGPRPGGRVLLLSRSVSGTGAASTWAQGGVAAAMGAGDTVDSHVADTIAAGAGLVDETAARAIVANAAAAIEDLVRLGVPFDRDAAGLLSLGREAAHAARRIVRVAGDGTGGAIMHTLRSAVRRAPWIETIEGVEARDLLVEGGRVCGLVVKRGGSTIRIGAGAVILATGGIGQLYDRTTNPLDARGDGIALAARAGAVLVDLEFVQFHPTAIDVDRNPRPLATEALRGEGAILVDAKGHRFMPAIDPAAELAARDVVARAIFRQLAAGRGAFLDCRTAVGDAFPERFPTVFELCRAEGIDPRVDPIPVAPAAHYHMGGIEVDATGRTSLAGLWAAGETACNGMHGANRLASNSLLEGLVSGAAVATDVAGSAAAVPPVLPDWQDEAESPPGASGAIERLRAAMGRHVGVVRDETGLATARSLFQTALDGEGAVARRATAAYLIATAALARRESRGGHFRSDAPVAVEALRTRRRWTLESARAFIPAPSAQQLPLAGNE